MSIVPSNKNRIIIASAGSRKTTFVVEEALVSEGRVLITTYTNENVDQIKGYIIQRRGHVPENITIQSWYSFLLGDGVRPYQNHLIDRKRIERIDFEDLPDTVRFVKKEDSNTYFVTADNGIYRDRVADFVCMCDERSTGLVIGRIAKIYDHIFIDELQDFAGYDLNVVERLFESTSRVVAVGDPRQATYSTNRSSKNKRFKRSLITDWVTQKNKAKVCTIEERVECFRSNQSLCDFADALFPGMAKTSSKNTTVTSHDGIFRIKRHEVLDYVKKYSPVVLRHSKKTDTLNLPSLNIGQSKGRTYDRVLIFATHPMWEYLKTGDLGKAGDLSKLYVAVTRARFSASFVEP